MHDDAKWHWSEGNKYATEIIKTMVVINGAAAVSVLTFIGNTRTHYLTLIMSMVCFSTGVLLSTLTQAAAYVTQLNYGNSSQFSETDPTNQRMWRRGEIWHYITYGFAVCALVMFAAGIICAAIGLRCFDPK